MARKSAQRGFETQVHMGLGEAILRLIHVEQRAAAGYGGVREDLISERDLILEALNQQYQLNLGFDCDMDGVPDTVEIFMQSAQTSCCRILPTEATTPQAAELAALGGAVSTKKAPVKKRSTSRKASTSRKPAKKKAAPKKKTPAKKKAAPKKKGLLSTIFGSSSEEEK